MCTAPAPSGMNSRRVSMGHACLGHVLQDQAFGTDYSGALIYRATGTLPLHLGRLISSAKRVNMRLKLTLIRFSPLLLVPTECDSQAGKTSKVPSLTVTVI